MPAKQTFVTQLLRIYHGGTSADAAHINLPAVDEVRYLCHVGLGPIAFQVYGDGLRQSDPALFSMLQSADLTTRVIYSQLEKATLELAGELQSIGVIPTFLKGISASQQYYTPPYLRVMGDIDVLIQDSEVNVVMARVAGLGYEMADENAHMNQICEHHLPAARHPETGVTIEVHTGLFAKAEFYSGENVFLPDNIAGQRIEFDYKGNRVARFTPEFQLIYTLSKWSVDRGWATNLKNINDAIHILKTHEAEFDWPVLNNWFAASPHLFPITAPLLHYLQATDILTIPAQLPEALACANRTLGPTKMRLLVWLLHTYPFNAVVKPPKAYRSWFAHALWLYLTRPIGRELGITRQLWYEFRQSALYGKYSPVGRTMSTFKALVYRDKKN